MLAVIQLFGESKIGRRDCQLDTTGDPKCGNYERHMFSFCLQRGAAGQRSRGIKLLMTSARMPMVRMRPMRANFS